MRSREEILAYNRKYCYKNRKRLAELTKVRYTHICQNCGKIFKSGNYKQNCCSLSCASQENRNRNWKGGISPLRQKLSASKEWIDLVKVIYKKFNNICQCCGKKISRGYRKKHIHHINGFKNRVDFFDIDRITLWCQHCHLSHHSKINVNFNRFKRTKTAHI